MRASTRPPGRSRQRGGEEDPEEPAGPEPGRCRRIARQLIYADGAARRRPAAAGTAEFELLNRSGHLFFEHDSALRRCGANRLALDQPAARVALIAGSAPAGWTRRAACCCWACRAAASRCWPRHRRRLRCTAAAPGRGRAVQQATARPRATCAEALASAEQLAPLRAVDGRDREGPGQWWRGRWRITPCTRLPADLDGRAQGAGVHRRHRQARCTSCRPSCGRFDEIFFVDLPSPDVRVELLRLHLGRRQLNGDDFALPALAAAANGFSGAEIEQAIVAGLYAHAEPAAGHRAADERDPPTRPLSVLMAEQVEHCGRGRRDGRFPQTTEVSRERRSLVAAG